MGLSLYLYHITYFCSVTYALKRICAFSGSATTPTPVVGSFGAFCCEKYKDFAPQIKRMKALMEVP